MAQKISVQLLDDLDGTEADESVEFGLDGVSYAIDLSEENAEQLRNALEAYVLAARKVGGRVRRPGKKAQSPATVAPTTASLTNHNGAGRTKPDRAQTQAIRAWLRAHGEPVSDRGRIPDQMMERYNREA